MAFQQGLSGLNVSSKAIDVTSHNIANSSTVGFKTGVTHFSDMYASSLNLAGNNRIGIGATVSAVAQQFSQGNLTSTSNSLDVSINGNGFFRMEDYTGALTYTRNGQFHLNNEGYIVNDQDFKLTGYPAVNGVVQSTTPQPIQVSHANIPPVATGTNPVSGLHGVKVGVNVDSRETEPISTWTNGPTDTTSGGWTPNVDTYNETTSIDVYDSLGNAHTLSMYFVKTANTNEWQVRANVDNTSDMYVTLSAAGAVGTAGGAVTVEFDSNGNMLTDMPLSISIDLDAINEALGLPANGATTALEFDVDFTGTTQHANAFGVNSLQQDGYSSGYITGLSVGEDGKVLGNYSNGQSFTLGQIALTSFMNNNGLMAVGNNQWKETVASGAPVVGKAMTSNLGALSSATVEESNVDLTNELVNLITFQRNYQANAQSIQTQDQMMQTIVNLR